MESTEEDLSLSNQRHCREYTQEFIDSFNHFLKDGIKNIIKRIRPVLCTYDGDKTVEITPRAIDINYPKAPEGLDKYPWECRKKKESYVGGVYLSVGFRINDDSFENNIKVYMGEIPIMVTSDKCYLKDCKEKGDFIKYNEEPNELGGYFIMKGNQYLLRYLISTRRNYPLSLKKENLVNAKKGVTGHIVFFRSVRDDDYSSEIMLIWSTIDSIVCKVQLDSGDTYEISLAIILRALAGFEYELMCEEIYNTLFGDDDFKSVTDFLLSDVRTNTQFDSQNKCLDYIGGCFRKRMKNIHDSMDNLTVGEIFLSEYVLVHTDNILNKFRTMVFCFAKLYTFATGKSCVESTDTLDFQEVHTSGYIYQNFFRASLADIFNRLPDFFNRNYNVKKTLDENIRGYFQKNKSQIVLINNLITSGTMGKKLICGIKQNKGLSVRLDNINFIRFMDNFRAVHRGKFFQESRSNVVRILRGEMWGFICPYNTPDGTNCGILNHLSRNAKIQGFHISKKDQEIKDEMCRRNIAVKSCINVKELLATEDFVPVMVDGIFMGYSASSQLDYLEELLRKRKLKIAEKPIPPTSEIVIYKRKTQAAVFPAVYVFTTPGRFLRPVINKTHKCIEYIGSMEQQNESMRIFFPGESAAPEDIERYNYEECDRTTQLSLAASCTPYQGCNPAPRNIYQCQMSKQSMGFTYYTRDYRSDNKLYELRCPQTPLVKAKAYNQFGLEDQPMGVNAVVAVMSYTAYDMEDAIILNEDSINRGMFDSNIYKSVVIDLKSSDFPSDNDIVFSTNDSIELAEELNFLGLPYINKPLRCGSPLYSTYNKTLNKLKVKFYEGEEEASVDCVTIHNDAKKVVITISVNRRPTIGDKFATRHGQKGVVSKFLRSKDMPRNQSGIVADIIFNPHSFPSRMTMGMLFEISMGKLASLSGKTRDGTSFDMTSVEIERNLMGLEQYNLLQSGEEFIRIGAFTMPEPITFGLCYYQRLRHMVKDKFQVRSEGKISAITRQPVKGRKKGGGVKIGEMERDGILSHGAVEVMQDRFVDSNSDSQHVCYCCGCMTWTFTQFLPPEHLTRPESFYPGLRVQLDNVHLETEFWKCMMCYTGDQKNSPQLVTGIYLPKAFILFNDYLLTYSRMYIAGQLNDDKTGIIYGFEMTPNSIYKPKAILEIEAMQIPEESDVSDDEIMEVD